jgi:hypothetical protein
MNQESQFSPSNILDRLILNAETSYIRKLERLNALRPALECAAALVAAFPDSPLEIREFLNGRDQIEVKLETTSLKEEVSMYLEWIEAWAREKGLEGFEFNETSDYVSQWTTQRDYHSIFLTLCADVKGSDKGCRKVVVGYAEVSPQPVYKIVCED